MVESTALEMRRTRKGTVGSNPTLSANPSEIRTPQTDYGRLRLGVTAISAGLSLCRPLTGQVSAMPFSR